jgi:hypothetical protein
LKLFSKIFSGILIICLFIIIHFFITDTTPKLTDKVVSMVINQPENQTLLQEEFKGISIKYEKKDKSSVHILKELYPNAKEDLDELYGESSSDKFTIIIYGNEKDFNKVSKFENSGGFYIPINNSIHIKSDKLMPTYKYEDLFVHEYTHYRTNKYLKENGISEDELPQWFDEGISEVMANMDTYVDIDLIEVMKFKNLDTPSEFYEGRKGDFDPYLQSYFAVNGLVNKFGLEIIPEILLTSKNNGFSDAFIATTGTSIDVLLTHYLERREVVKDLVDEAGEYQEKNDYKMAQETLLEVLRLEPTNSFANQIMPHILIKQNKFSQALSLLRDKKELNTGDLQIFSELSLLNNLNESQKYTEALEEMIRNNNSDSSYKSPLGEIIRKNLSDPVNGFLIIIEEDLINYEEIISQLKINLKLKYPNDPRVENIDIH